MSALDSLVWKTTKVITTSRGHEGEQETNTERGLKTGMRAAVQVLPLLIDAILLVVDP